MTSTVQEYADRLIEPPLEVNERPEKPRHSSGDSAHDPLAYAILAIVTVQYAFRLLKAL
jgi:hypothetical protein